MQVRAAEEIKQSFIDSYGKEDTEKAYGLFVHPELVDYEEDLEQDAAYLEKLQTEPDLSLGTLQVLRSLEMEFGREGVINFLNEQLEAAESIAEHEEFHGEIEEEKEAENEESVIELLRRENFKLTEEISHLKTKVDQLNFEIKKYQRHLSGKPNAYTPGQELTLIKDLAKEKFLALPKDLTAGTTLYMSKTGQPKPGSPGVSVTLEEGSSNWFLVPKDSIDIAG